MENLIEVNINLNVNELNVVFAALQELPHRIANPLLIKIEQQAKTQLESVEEKAAKSS